MKLDLKDKRVVVTGASSDIGRAIARAFMLHGAKVVAHSHHNACPVMEIQKEAREIQHGASSPDDGPPPTSYVGRYVHIPIGMPADLTNHDERTSFIRGAIKELGGIDVLVNNAGDAFGATSFLGLSYESWQKTLELDLTAPFFLSREAFSYMRDHGGGRIINISSIAAKYGGSDITMHYGAAKAGLENVTKAMAKQGAAHGVLVNVIQLGVIDTKFQVRLGRDIKEKAKTIPLKRVGRPDEVADLCLFLASERASFITGQTYGLTGGD